MKQKTLGYSVWGRPIACLEGGAGERKVLFCAALPGGAWMTGRVLWRYLAELERRTDWQKTARLWAVPCVNPDGAILAMGRLPVWSPQYIVARAIAGEDLGFPLTWKANGRGVDLNRNYPTGWEQAVRMNGLTEPAPRNWPGPAPLSEPESRLLARLAEEIRPDVTVILQAQGEEICWEPGGICPENGSVLGTEMACRSGYRLIESPPESAFGSFSGWLKERIGCPAFTVRCGSGANSLPLSRLDEICEQVFPILDAALLFDFC